jgi:hypothetical protein
MNTSRILKLLAAALTGITCLCLAAAWFLYAQFGDYLPSFPEAFFGQLTLTRETRPIQSTEYHSAEFVLGQIPAWEVERAEYIALGEEVFFWEPPYPGFARTSLSEREVQDLYDLFSAGQVFQSSPAGNDYHCLTRRSLPAPRLESCPEGAEWMDRYAGIKGWSDERQSTGVLVAYLRGGGPESSQRKVVEIRIFRSEQGLAYEPREAAGNWWLKGITGPSALVDAFDNRVRVQPVELLWPDRSPEAANARAERILGDSYPRALEAVRLSPEVQAAYGSPVIVRPARATNIYASWMDSTSITLTLAASGPHGEGAVLVRGFAPFEPFEIEMVREGKRVVNGPRPR